METDVLEAELRFIYGDLKKQLPELHHLTFELGEYKHSGNSYLYGFYHIGSSCKPYEDLSDLKSQLDDKIQHRQILFRKF